MKYRVEEYKLRNGLEGVRIIFDDEKYDLLGTFLQSDVLPFEDWIKADFDKVIYGKSKMEKVSGNVCFVEIGPNITKIYDSLAEDDEEYGSSCCEVDTQKMRQLIDEWCNQVKEFRETHPKR